MSVWKDDWSIYAPLQVVCALSSCKPVVSPDWVREAVRCRRSSLPLPAPSAYQPQVVDSNLAGCGEDRQAVLFAPDYNRTALFKDWVFYFLSEKQVCMFNGLRCAFSVLLSSNESLSYSSTLYCTCSNIDVWCYDENIL